MSSIDELIERHGEGTVKKAFWLQEHIYEEGIEGANFSEAAIRKMKIIKYKTVKQAIES